MTKNINILIGAVAAGVLAGAAVAHAGSPSIAFDANTAQMSDKNACSGSNGCRADGKCNGVASEKNACSGSNGCRADGKCGS